jgi:hypothetical protein
MLGQYLCVFSQHLSMLVQYLSVLTQCLCLLILLNFDSRQPVIYLCKLFQNKLVVRHPYHPALLLYGILRIEVKGELSLYLYLRVCDN